MINTLARRVQPLTSKMIKKLTRLLTQRIKSEKQINLKRKLRRKRAKRAMILMIRKIPRSLLLQQRKPMMAIQQQKLARNQRKKPPLKSKKRSLMTLMTNWGVLFKAHNPIQPLLSLPLYQKKKKPKPSELP